MKAFNRSNVRDLTSRIPDALKTLAAELGLEFTVDSARFSEDTTTFRLVARTKNEMGVVEASAHSHGAADGGASRFGLKLFGHLIGSTWYVREEVYTCIGYNTSRPKYPIQLKRVSDGRVSKATFGFLQSGEQLVMPSAEDFKVWFTVDPDSDAVKESDVEICDRVQRYLENVYPQEEGDTLFSLVDEFNEMGVAAFYHQRAYEALFIKGIQYAISLLSKDIKRERRK